MDRINDRWTRIPEVEILEQLMLLPVKWQVEHINTPLTRYYLSGSPYVYPYSLPVEVVQRLASLLNEVHMFDWQVWRNKFIQSPGYNDAGLYGVVVSNTVGRLYDVIGVHHLTPEENQVLHHIFIDVLDQDNKRIMGATVKWTWEGRTESGEPSPLLIDKPDNEIASLQFFSGVTINIWHPTGNGVTGLSANHPDEGGGNTLEHHSFMVVFRRVIETISPPEPPPTQPPIEEIETVMLLKKTWLDQQPVDEDGFIRIKS